ncbi:MAG: phosphate transport system regulatory protein PhoU [Bacteroidetes bacterium GWE2_29_8]|nr:MAG: phosphate transport system regulatory protein PhoU [Bacteroidetes bacterium GWE2_29_8]OFY23198.1 MAG: phosphate transport system regulatory protein PhoU [Bacteroidetes bacterium GWF2_29_10]
MTHLDVALPIIKKDLLKMMMMVKSQVSLSKDCLEKFDKELAYEVLSNEKKIDAFELKLNMDCENVLALYNPVAIDLRFVMASYTITADLERIADKAASIARFVTDLESPLAENISKKLQIKEMYEQALIILDDVYDVLENEDTALGREVFKKDDLLNNIYKNSTKASLELIKENPNNSAQILYAYSSVKKIERIGDLAKSIIEEIIFYIEAKVMKHSKLDKNN